MSLSESATHQAVRYDEHVPFGACGSLPDLVPCQGNTLVEHGPAFAPRWYVVSGEGVCLEFGVGQSSKVPEVAFPERRLQLHPRAGALANKSSCFHCAREVTRQDPGYPHARNPFSQLLRLNPA